MNYKKQKLNSILSNFISKEQIKSLDKIMNKKSSAKSKIKLALKNFGIEYNQFNVTQVTKAYGLKVSNNNSFAKEVLIGLFMYEKMKETNGSYFIDGRKYSIPLNIIKLMERDGQMDYFKTLIGYNMNPYNALVNAIYDSTINAYIIKRPLTQKELKILKILNKDVSTLTEEEVEFVNNYTGFLKQLLPTSTEVVISVKVENDPYSVNSISVLIDII